MTKRLHTLVMAPPLLNVLHGFVDRNGLTDSGRPLPGPFPAVVRLQRGAIPSAAQLPCGQNVQYGDTQNGGRCDAGAALMCSWRTHRASQGCDVERITGDTRPEPIRTIGLS